MKPIQKVLWLFALCTNMLFFSKNANAQCSGFNVTATQTADGSSKGDAEATATITGATSPNFLWHTSSFSAIAWGTTAYNLNAGTYCVIATDTVGTSSCRDTFYLTIIDTGTFNCVNLQSSMWEADSCQIGDVNLYTSAWGGSGSYSYSWNIGATGQNLLNKTNGTFSVIITDILYGCKDTLYKTVVDDTCNVCTIFKNNGYIFEYDPCQKNDIELTAYKWAGSYSYKYLWNTGATSQSIYNKGAGSYWVKVTDSVTGCIDTLFITVADDTCSPCQYFNASFYENDSCQKNDITLTAYPQDSLGTARYKYLWNTGATTKFLTNRGAGSYWVKVTDSILGCVDTAYITVVDDTCNPCQNFQVIIGIHDTCQLGDVLLSAQISGSYSTYPWKYQWNTGETTRYVLNKTSGNFWVRMTDTITGCIDTAFITVADDTCNICDSFKNGGYIYESDPCQKNDITLTAYKWAGSQSYFYLWNTGATTQSINNKGGGSYWVKITDTLYGCIDTLFITVTDDTCSPCQYFNASIYENDSCQKNDITLTAYPRDSLGTARYKYLWNTGATSKFLTDKGAGSYWVKVTDSILGCVDTAYITVVDDTCNPCDNFGGYMYKHDSCKVNDLKIYANAYGGSGNYSYSWNTGSTASFLTNQGTGWYKVTITDVINGCVYKDSIYAIDSNFKCCQAYFYTNDSAVASTKTFYGYSNVYDSISGGTITYAWNFGDGNTGTGQTKNHTYTSSGNKTVCLYLTTASGCKDTFCSVVNSPAPGKNLKVSHYGISYIKDTNRYTYITYQNIGTTTENGIVEYKYPSGMTLVSSTISPLTHIGNKITFSVGSLAPGASGTIYVVMKTPTSFTLGSIKCDTAIILPVSGDIAPSNNSSYECDSVVASWDPNDKTPNPKGIGSEGNISPTTSEIGYLIRFENEGNWRTYRVRVEDEIDPSFDINSLMIGDASHAYRLVRKDNKLTWFFDNIELTPKSVDPNRSHGYIQYTLHLKPGLSIGTKLRNTAYIYFDANPAIITNTTKNTLKNTDGSASIDRIESNDLLDFDLKRYGDRLTIFSPSKMHSIKIYDISGKLLLDKDMNSDKLEIENIRLSQGIYIVNVEINEQTVIKKFRF